MRTGKSSCATADWGRIRGDGVNPGLFKLAAVGSRSAYGRLAGTAGGVAVGVCLLLLLSAARQQPGQG